ncbi:MAG: NADPH-dependent F420 reductase [Acidobacteria bacterium]|nr:NADPH-dependent F420 reductase [Acidobacteriota bacterium]
MSRRIAIVGGTGPEGRGLALRWARAGEDLIIGSRDAERAQRAAEVVAKAAGTIGRIAGMGNADAVAATDLVVLTVPFSGHAEILKQLKTAFRPGTILIDTTVPLAATVGGRPTRTLGVWQGSAAEQAAELVPEGVMVVAAFQNLSHEALDGAGPVDCDVIVCGDDAAARQAVRGLAEKIPGARGVDGGRLENARIVEQLTALLIGINLRYKARAAGLRITGLPL